jgi:hypothetical protein
LDGGAARRPQASRARWLAPEGASGVAEIVKSKVPFNHFAEDRRSEALRGFGETGSVRIQGLPRRSNGCL